MSGTTDGHGATTGTREARALLLYEGGVGAGGVGALALFAGVLLEGWPHSALTAMALTLLLVGITLVLGGAGTGALEARHDPSRRTARLAALRAEGVRSPRTATAACLLLLATLGHRIRPYRDDGVFPPD